MFSSDEPVETHSVDAFDRAVIGMCLTDRSGRVLRANRSVCDILGFDERELKGRGVDAISDPGGVAEVDRAIDRLTTGSTGSERLVLPCTRVDGRPLWVQVDVSMILEADGEPLLLWQLQDVTQSREDAALLREQAGLLELAGEAIIVRDMEARIGYWNRGAAERYGWTPDEARGANIHDLLVTDFPQTREAVERALIEHGRWQGELIHTHKDGGRMIVLSRQVLRLDDAGRPTAVLEINSDVTEQKRADHNLRNLALVDELTELANRRAFFNVGGHELSVARRAGRGLSVVFIDLNGMKRINDAHGHQVGDHALRTAAELLRQTFRESDLIARLSGDEFCVLQPDGTLASARRSVERLMDAMRVQNESSKAPYVLSLSAGIGVLEPGEDVTLGQLIERADEAMYSDKAVSRPRPRILVVEDDDSLQTLLGIVLGQQFEVVVVGSGEAALEILGGGTIDCVVTDKNLPGLSGTELAARLKGDPKKRHIPVLMLTGEERDGELEGLMAGVDDYVLKPFDPDVLQLRLQNLTRPGRR